MILNKSLIFLNMLSHIGAENLPPDEKRRVVLTNRVNIFLGALATFFIFPWAMKGSWFMVASNCFFSLFHCSLIWMNKKHWHFLPRFLLVVLVSTGIFIVVGMVGKVGDFHVCLIPIAGFSLLFFDPRNKLQMALGVLYPIALLAILDMNNYKFLPNYIGEPLTGLTTFTYSMNILMVMITSMYFYRINFDTEKKYQTLYEEHIKAQKQLDEERARAIFASKMVSLGEMAGGIAHEINGPLWLVAVSAEQLKTAAKEEKLDQEKVLGISLRISETSARIAEIIRALGKVSRSAETSPLQETCLKTLIHDTLIVCNHRFYLKSIKLEILIPEQLPMINCRPVEISQVLLNLLNNAFDASSEITDPLVVIEVINVNNKINLIVRDNGPGIPLEVREKIFETFFTTKPVGKGTGLGLSISKKIIESHNGRMFLDMSSGKTSFVVELPV